MKINLSYLIALYLGGFIGWMLRVHFGSPKGLINAIKNLWGKK